jgi:hypothetical protein
VLVNDATPARRACRREVLLHRLLDDLAAENRAEDFIACREALAHASADRHALATLEHDDTIAMAA